MADHENEFELSLQKRPEPGATAVQLTSSRYLAEVQGMLFLARQFPRDQHASWLRIKEACSRKGLAEVAQYKLPRGDKPVTGPSIRLAEAVAGAWGNISYGTVELEQKATESTAMAFAWDLETNVRVERIFTVKHQRDTKSGAKDLTSGRDKYEIVANFGSRRERACILKVIPRDVVDNAIKECEKTMRGGSKIPIVDRIRAMLEAFVEFSVTKEMIEKHVGYTVDKFVEQDILELKKIHTTLKDGMAKREDFFELDGPAGKSEPSAEDEKLKAEFAKEQATKKGQPQQTEMRQVGEEG